LNENSLQPVLIVTLDRSCHIISKESHVNIVKSILDMAFIFYTNTLFLQLYNSILLFKEFLIIIFAKYLTTFY